MPVPCSIILYLFWLHDLNYCWSTNPTLCPWFVVCYLLMVTWISLPSICLITILFKSRQYFFFFIDGMCSTRTLEDEDDFLARRKKKVDAWKESCLRVHLVREFWRGGVGREGGEQIFLKFDCIAIIILKLISNLNINFVTTFIIIYYY